MENLIKEAGPIMKGRINDDNEIITNMKNNRHVYVSKYLTVSLKIRHFNCFETSIFLYNCALWTLTPSMIKALDVFHRRQLRYALGIYYPKKISNAELYRHKTLECCCEGT